MRTLARRCGDWIVVNASHLRTAEGVVKEGVEPWKWDSCHGCQLGIES
jgi:hypothetical protein